MPNVMEMFRYFDTFILLLIVLSHELLINAVIQYGKLHNNIVLRCANDNWKRRSWFKDSEKLTIGNKTNDDVNNRLEIEQDDINYNLHIYNVIDSDAGQYQCVIQDKNNKVHTHKVTLSLFVKSTTHDIPRLQLTTEEQPTNQSFTVRPEDNKNNFPYKWVYFSSIVVLVIFIGWSIWMIRKAQKRMLVQYESNTQSTLHENTMYDYDWRNPRNK